MTTVANDATPTLAVWKFASCDGCQLTLLDCEDELLTVANRVRVAHFLEASSATVAGPYDISLVEGSVSTPADVQRIRGIREQSRVLVTIGACATAGGIQALRNLTDAARYRSAVYARPEYLATLDTSRPISDYVPVDVQLPGCPIDRRQLLGLLDALLAGRRPDLPGHSVCFECKARGTPCVLVAHATPCLGPVTRAGCGAICPAYGRGCYGCFGPAEQPNLPAMLDRLRELGESDPALIRVLRTFNAQAPAFATASAQVATGQAADTRDGAPGAGMPRAGEGREP